MAATGVEAKSDGESDVEQYELTEDEDEQQQEQEKAQQAAHGSAKRKRKRSLSQNDEEELARRRRKRRSLAFQQRRRSLTPSERKANAAAGAGGAAAAPAHSKQYISDMYSTIIKMSSENKINVKNSWSLHLIDHMEDILDSSKKSADADADDDTYNFQKASCTLDASIKIYSYRVDDTWNSSYKILENLSRTEQKHGAEDAGSDGEGAARTARKTRKTHARTIEKNLNNINLKAYDTECEADPLFHKMSQSFDEGGAKGMLLANLSVYDGCKILLNSSDVSVVTRKPIHEVAGKAEEEEQADDAKPKDLATEAEASDGKDSADPAKAESKDEGEDGEAENDNKDEQNEGDDATKDKSGSENEGSDVDVAMEEDRDKKKEGSSEDAEMEGPEKEKGDLSGDVTTEEEQSKEKNDFPQCEAAEDTKAREGDSTDAPEATKEKDEPLVAKRRISLSIFGNLSCLSQDVQNMGVCPPLYRMYDQLDEFYGDESRHKLGIKNDFLLKTPVKGRRKTLDKQDVIIMNLAGIMEGASEDESNGEDAPHDTSVDFGDDNAAYDADEDGGDAVGETEDVAEVEPTDDVDMEKEKNIIDLAGSDNEDSLQDGLSQDGLENGPQALDKESSLKSTAADFFRAKVNENLPENYENNLFSQMIESALVRSGTLEDEQGGEGQDGKNDYSYFDVKMLRNWAGPGHWKFPAVRKIQMKQRLKEEAERDGNVGVNGEVDEDGVVIKAEPTERSTDRVRKGSSAGVDKKAAITVDFFGEEPDLSRLKVPKSASSLEVSKGNLKKQAENAADLVLPVDTHIELGLFFRHFLKERPRFFRKRGSGALDGAHREGALANNFEFGDSSGDTADDHDREQPFTYNEDCVGFEPGYDDEDEGTSGADDTGTETMYSVEDLVQADRVVEKIGVHYERFAKRVDVKKLKGSIWDHLEKKVVKNEEEKRDAAGNNAEKADDADPADSAATINESGKRQREAETDEKDEGSDDEALGTTFENVVEDVAGKVPSNVTVSFYFICVLHLANEKGLELVGQDDLRNFQIRKENS
ncbi:hypothetical protein PHYPSEUDO_006136 [Phytophthora pseudosyringae]|uniref:Condensin complex subunit 2 n=1 Tax=Phytophthora pseudosyringae TaxID=221518 RepID=A0A8T1WCQ6_9STRA|nr:hypothetical protein PHYPSEUDO_006136 [Phytophthora pseudosyringae]